MAIFLCMYLQEWKKYSTFEGTFILEATEKNVAYDKKSKLFLYIYIFFSTFAVAKPSNRFGRHIIKSVY